MTVSCGEISSPSYSAWTSSSSHPCPSRRRQAAPGALLEHGDRLVDAAEDRLLLLEDLHEDARVVALEIEQVARQVEVLVGVVALAHALDGQAERPVEGQARHAVIL